MPLAFGQDSCLETSPPSCHQTVEGDTLPDVPTQLMRRRKDNVLKRENTNDEESKQLWQSWKRWWKYPASTPTENVWLVEKSPSNMQRLPYLEASFASAQRIRAVVTMKNPIFSSSIYRTSSSFLSSSSAETSLGTMEELLQSNHVSNKEAERLFKSMVGTVQDWLRSYAILAQSLSELNGPMKNHVRIYRYEDLVSPPTSCHTCCMIASSGDNAEVSHSLCQEMIKLKRGDAFEVCREAGACLNMEHTTTLTESSPVKSRRLDYHGDRTKPHITLDNSLYEKPGNNEKTNLFLHHTAHTLQERANIWRKVIELHMPSRHLSQLHKLEPIMQLCGKYSLMLPSHETTSQASDAALESMSAVSAIDMGSIGDPSLIMGCA
jgi:hypothetical protein